MPSIEKHTEISMQRTSKSYHEVLEWIDGPQHKNERHDITRVLEFSRMSEEKYGEQAAREYVQHLANSSALASFSPRLTEILTDGCETPESYLYTLNFSLVPVSPSKISF